MDHQQLQLPQASQRFVCDLINTVEPQVHAFHVFRYSRWDGDEGAEGAVELSGLRAGAGSGAGDGNDWGRNDQHQQEDAQGGRVHLHPRGEESQQLSG